MAIRNRRKRTNSDYISPTCPPGWAWLLAGILIGVFISFLVYLREIAPRTLPPETALVTSQPLSKESATDPNAQPNPSADLQFYDLLPDSKVNVPPTEESTKPASEFPITVPGRYLLQVGSYQNEQEAEGLKNYLVNSLGIPARIEKTNLSESGRWYRVQIGPSDDLDTLNKIGAKLDENQIPVLVRKF
jgi:cell division protein FtsN